MNHIEDGICYVRVKVIIAMDHMEDGILYARESIYNDGPHWRLAPRWRSRLLRYFDDDGSLRAFEDSARRVLLDGFVSGVGEDG